MVVVEAAVRCGGGGGGGGGPVALHACFMNAQTSTFLWALKAAKAEANEPKP